MHGPTSSERETHRVGGDTHAPKLKRRASAPIESLFMNPNPFSIAARKKLRLSEPDDLSTALSIKNIPRNRDTSVSLQRFVSTEPSRLSEATTSKPTTRRADRAVIATMNNDKSAPTPTTRARPNLSVRIPPPRLYFTSTSHSSPSAIHTIAEHASRLDDNDGEVIVQIHHSDDNTSISTSSHNPIDSPHTPLPHTPLDQLVRRPSNPPAIPRHAPQEHSDSQTRRVERLYAPTPTEWSFSATLNRVPTPMSESFGPRTPMSATEAGDDNDTDDLDDDDDDAVTIDGDDDHCVDIALTSEGGLAQLQLPENVRSVTGVPMPISYFSSSFLANTDGAQPLASPYATRFPSPAPTSASLSTPKSSPVASYFPLMKTTPQQQSLKAQKRKSLPLKQHSLPFPSRSPGPSLPQSQSQSLLVHRPSIPHRRSSLGPGRSLNTSLPSSASSTNSTVSLSSPLAPTFPSESPTSSSESSFGPQRRTMGVRRSSLMGPGGNKSCMGAGPLESRPGKLSRPGLRAPRLSWSGVKGLKCGDNGVSEVEVEE